MSADWKFLRKVLLGYTGMAAAVSFSLVFLLPSGQVESAVAAAVLGAVNFVLGFLAIEYSFEKSHTTFLKAILGGMAVRLLAMTGAVVVLIKVYEFDALALMLALLWYYAVNLALEIYFLQKKVSLKKPQ